MDDYEYTDLTQAGNELQTYLQNEAQGGNAWLDDVDLATLTRFGVDIAKIYTAANGQKVQYRPVQTATGTRYQLQPAGMGGLFSNPMVLGGAALLAFIALRR